MFIQVLTQDPNMYFMWITLVVFSVCCHEYMHARTALWQGDDTAAQMGHLTLNPLKQMGPMAIVMLLLIGITWGQVPVDPHRMRRRYSRMLVSFSGPATNLMLFVGFVLLATVAIRLQGPKGALVFFSRLGASLNFVLFAFNLLPMPPLDGYTVFSYFFPRVFRLDTEFQKGVMVFLFILVFFSFRWLWLAGSLATELAIGILNLGAEMILRLPQLLGGGVG
jgi:Zn-dependent protease